uniref:Uncharacterized protein n=1 Tax=Lepeophtheirus salmonis TaxID=72036 RepID=A0A0K2TFD5_LEPSM
MSLYGIVHVVIFPRQMYFISLIFNKYSVISMRAEVV